MSFDETYFLQRYNKLNAAQKEAVDTIDGPVMVIAGPGTGKTEVLAVRIANLLRSAAQIQPHEILCLTFTDEATVAMRRRLLQVIGEAAHKVNIYTFHAFCSHLIQNHPDFFGARDVMPLSDLERMELLYDLISHLPEGHLLRRLKGEIFYDAKRLADLFNLMKSEYWTAEAVEKAVAWCEKEFPNLGDYRYKGSNPGKGYVVGDLRQDKLDEDLEKLRKTAAAAGLYDEYTHRMEALGRYDYNDMILWVLKAFKEHPSFLRIQQERFQYILSDEFQDTSGAQSELLTSLASYWETPNLFVVGDDDQSIFEFQGARLQNILDFYSRYRNVIRVIVLKENYRSSQLILDAATASIKHNTQRLINQLSDLHLDKNIIAANEEICNGSFPAPVVCQYYNQQHEEMGVVKEIESLQRAGVPLNKVAVIYAQHKQAANIIDLLDRKSIPYSVKRPVDVLNQPLVLRVLDILIYLDAELKKSFSGEERLFRLLHAEWFGILPLDIASLSLYLQSKEKKHKHWRHLLQDSLLLESLELERPSALYRLGQHLEQWITDSQTLTLPMLLEKIVYDGGILSGIMKGKDPLWEMQVLHTFFAFVKDEAVKDPRISPSDFLGMVEKMVKEKIELPLQKVTYQEEGVRFYTAHGAKGLEFEYVFIIGLTKNFWEGRKGANHGFTIPEPLIRQKISTSKPGEPAEVVRRLFYVAMTRAQKYLRISFAEKDNQDKPLQHSCLVDEIRPLCTWENRALPSDELLPMLEAFLTPSPGASPTLAKRSLLERRLSDFVLSLSAMNKYLKCPRSFFYEYILRAPQAKSDALAFGTAIHYALEVLFNKMTDHPEKQFPAFSEILDAFYYKMWREESAFTELQYERRRELGKNILNEYYHHYLATFNKVVVCELNIARAVIDGVPIKGKVDKIEFTGNECIVIDYKTGNPDYASGKELKPPSDNQPNGGDYWRQMVFYKILLENAPVSRKWKVQEGIFEFIEKNKKGAFVRFTVPLFENDLTTVRQQIKEVYAKIMDHQFEQGCEEKNCYWCDFSKKYDTKGLISTVVI